MLCQFARRVRLGIPQRGRARQCRAGYRREQGRGRNRIAVSEPFRGGALPRRFHAGAGRRRHPRHQRAACHGRRWIPGCRRCRAPERPADGRASPTAARRAVRRAGRYPGHPAGRYQCLLPAPVRTDVGRGIRQALPAFIPHPPGRSQGGGGRSEPDDRRGGAAGCAQKGEKPDLISGLAAILEVIAGDLSQTQRRELSLWAGLPLGEWTPIHRRVFTIGCLWLMKQRISSGRYLPAGLLPSAKQIMNENLPPLPCPLNPNIEELIISLFEA